MAKISYATFVTGISGKSGNSVFFRSPSTAYGYLRNYVYPTLTATNTARGKEFANMCFILKSVTTAGLADLKAYAKKFAKLPTVGGSSLKARANNHVAVWILALWNVRKENGTGIDLTSITVNDLVSLFGFTDLATIIEAGYLPAVDGYEAYNHPISA